MPESMLGIMRKISDTDLETPMPLLFELKANTLLFKDSIKSNGLLSSLIRPPKLGLGLGLG